MTPDDMIRRYPRMGLSPVLAIYAHEGEFHTVTPKTVEEFALDLSKMGYPMAPFFKYGSGRNEVTQAPVLMSSRYKTLGGTAHHRGGRPEMIVLSSRLFMRDWLDVWETFLHEVAHLFTFSYELEVTGRTGAWRSHGPQWRMWARRMGISATRCHSIGHMQRHSWKHVQMSGPVAASKPSTKRSASLIDEIEIELDL